MIVAAGFFLDWVMSKMFEKGLVFYRSLLDRETELQIQKLLPFSLYPVPMWLQNSMFHSLETV